MKSINSECFTYDLYCNDWWHLFDVNFLNMPPFEILKKYAIGFCKGESLKVKPRKNTFAVMFIKDEDKFWFHIDNNSEFYNYLKSIKGE